MRLTAGERLGPYEIVAPIGAGGMGEVYRAIDPRLHRAVAIKILGGASSPDSRARFLQEARAASGLNHPNIVQVYDVGSTDGTDFIVMELVEGATLLQAIGPKGLDTAAALDYAIQIADGLAAAHTAGVVHRDVKPANVRITPKGVVKVLDFGLAKVAEPCPAGGDEDDTRTMGPKTVQGALVGTLAYLSPEHAECKAIDNRSDIFVFGAMLYEMLTGQRAFQRDSTAATLSAILREDPPPLTKMAPSIPRELDAVVLRCLRKDPAARFQTMDEVALALRAVRGNGRGRSNAWRRLAWMAGASVALAAAWWLWPHNSALRVIDLQRVTSDAGLTMQPVLSRDGKMLAYASDRAGGALNIWVQQVGGGQPVQVTKGPVDDSEPSFSPDGTLIAFHSQRDGGGLYVVPALGGVVRRIADEGRRPLFSPDGEWIAYWVGEEGVYSRNQLRLVRLKDGETRRLAKNFFSAYWPVWSPDGAYVLFLGAESDRKPIAERYDWWVAPFDGGPPVATGALQEMARHGVYSLNGRPGDWSGNSILFPGTTKSQGELPVTIWTQQLARNPWRAQGKPVQLTSGAGIEVQPWAAADKLVLAATTEYPAIWMLPLDADTGQVKGAIERVTSSNSFDEYPAVSRDGRKLAFASDRQKNNIDVFVKDLPGGIETALTTSEFHELGPLISADGLRVLYYMWRPDRKPSFSFWQVDARGGTPLQVCGDCDGSLYCWSNDEQKVIYFKDQPGKLGNLTVRDFASGREWVFAVHPKYEVRLPRLSWDERWVAFQTVVSQTQRKLFVAAVSDWRAAPEETWIPIPDARAPTAWSPSGNVLYFLSDRDGFRCIWGQRLDPAAKRPVGPAFAVQHLHLARRSFAMSREIAGIGLSLTPHELFFSMPERTGNVWIAQLEGRP
jgi:Tol biopolymer transport system component